MENDGYLEIIKDRLKNNYNLEENVCYENYKIDLVALCKIRKGIFLVSKEEMLRGYESNDFIFVQKYDEIELEDIRIFVGFLKEWIGKNIKPNIDHKCSNINGIMVTNKRMSYEVKEYIEGYKYSKIFMMYLKGWCDIRIAGVNASKNEFVSNREGIVLNKLLETNLSCKNK